MISPRHAGRPQLFLTLQDRIKSGHYVPGSWLPTERALAQEFGLDRSAVRQALSQLEDRKLIVREPGRRPWVRGGHLAPREGPGGGDTQQTDAVGLRTIVAILPQHPVYPASLAILYGINTTLRSMEVPFRLQVIDTHGGSEARETSLEKRALESVIEEKIAGVVLWHMGGAETLPQIWELDRQGIPVVFVDRHPAELSCDFVGIDNHESVEVAITYLRQLGHRRIAHLTTDEKTTAVIERLAAYRVAMPGIDTRSFADLIFTVPHEQTLDVAPACDHFFGLPDPPTAVFAMNDSLAYQFIAECRRRGKDVPGDISVIGCDDLEQHSPRPPLLTTLHQPFDQMGRRAAGLLLRRLAGSRGLQEARQHLLLSTKLVPRLTCRPL